MVKMGKKVEKIFFHLSCQQSSRHYQECFYRIPNLSKLYFGRWKTFGRTLNVGWVKLTIFTYKNADLGDFRPISG